MKKLANFGKGLIRLAVVTAVLAAMIMALDALLVPEEAKGRRGV